MKTRALKGMRDLLPDEQLLRDYVQNNILNEVNFGNAFLKKSFSLIQLGKKMKKTHPLL